MEKKSDRRIRRTKALLRHGLAQLMSEKSVNEVTVKELVDLVDINRSTFYLHYTDIYNMLESVEDELFDEILHTIRTHPSVHSTKTVFLSSRISLPFCSTTGKSVPPCWPPRGHRLSAPHRGDAFSVQPGCPARSFSRADGQSEIHLCLLRGRRRGLIKDWLSHGCEESPQHMAQLTFRLVTNTVSDFYPHS